ncbi:MAG TPA: hypothetical protein VG709_05520 [Actinomycetota bacterium]|nr:hypothetical protein [Actinomycetota bacterium]
MEERPDRSPEKDPTVDADEVEPEAPGPGDSEGARPEPDPDEAGEDRTPPEPTGGIPDDAADSSPDAATPEGA